METHENVGIRKAQKLMTTDATAIDSQQIEGGTVIFSVAGTAKEADIDITVRDNMFH